MGQLDWMADALRAAGLRVVEYPGWRDRHASGIFLPRAVMWHHDASPAGPSPSMDDLIAVRGNKTTPPPLAQCWVDTAGVWHLLASGRANHAGTGRGWGRVSANAGNRDAIGIETDHTVGEPWPPAQLDALRRGTKVLLNRMAADPAHALCGHKEYAPNRKIDPAGLDMAQERQIVAALDVEDDMFNDSDRDDLRAMAWRLYSAVMLWDTVPDHPSVPEPVRGEEVPLVAALKRLDARPVADVDETALAAELEARGIGGVTAAEVKEIVLGAFARAATDPAPSAAGNTPA